MKITEVKVFPVEEEKLKAFVSIVFDGCFMVNDIKVIRGRDGLFISMPSRRKKNGKFKDVAHPLNNETRRMIEDQILEEYRAALGDRAAQTPTEARRLPTAGAPAGSAPEAAAPPPAPAATAPAAAPPRETSPPPAQPAAGTERFAAPAAAAEPAGSTGPGGSTDPVEPPSADPPEEKPEEKPEARPTEEPRDEKSLEEVTEIHLRDSFWST